MPREIDEPDFTELKRLVRDHVAELEKDGWVNEDSGHYIFEAAVTAMYGNSVWSWYRSCQI